MKKIIYYEFLQMLKAKPKLMQKIMIFALVGIGGFLIVGALMIWAGVTTLNYVASSASRVIQSQIGQSQAENLKANPKSSLRIQALNCWGKAQSLIAVKPWLERTALDNLLSLKVTCFEKSSDTCEGAECEKMKELINTAKGSVI